MNLTATLLRLALSRNAGTVAVAFGGAAGALARFGVCAALGTSEAAVLICNVVGTFVLACAAETVRHLHPHARKMVSVGFCGGFTTFATFSRDSIELLREGNADFFFVNIAGNFALCALAIYAAEMLADFMRRRRNFLRKRRQAVAELVRAIRNKVRRKRSGGVK